MMIFIESTNLQNIFYLFWRGRVETSGAVKEFDEKALIRGCLSGDRSAWESFVLKYTKLVYYVINKVNWQKSASLVEEEIQDLHNEVFLALLEKKLAQFESRSGCSLASWVKIVTVSTTLNFLKARQVRARYKAAGESSHEMRVPIQFVADSASCPENSFLGKETLSRLEDFVGPLPSREKLFLNLHYNRYLSLEEIAGVLKMSKGALYTMKSRLQKRMKEVLLETDNAN